MELKDGQATFYAASRSAWRQWLQEHGPTEKPIWLIIYRQESQTPSVHFEEAIEEATCYGWVDSKARRRDGGSFYLRFTPRNPGSAWGKISRERAEKMMREGLMAPAGQAVIDASRQNGAWDALMDAQNLVIPDDLQSLFDQNESAFKNFQAFSPSARRILLEWIATARRPETRRQRIEKTVQQAAQNLKAHTG